MLRPAPMELTLPRRFRISARGKDATIEARDESEVWAKFCDLFRVFQSRRIVKPTITEIK